MSSRPAGVHNETLPREKDEEEEGTKCSVPSTLAIMRLRQEDCVMLEANLHYLVSGYPGLHSEFQTKLGYRVRSRFKKS